MFLGGDIGGTKTNLALFEYRIDHLEIKVEEKYPSHEYKSLDEIVQDFLSKNPTDLKSAVFGIAGPVHNGHVKTTNLPWTIDASKLSEIVKSNAYLINDLEANAWGISALKDEEFHLLQKGDLEAKGNRALISAGTGLGEAGLYFDSKKHLPFACEGGHVDFAPRNEEEVKLFSYLQKEFEHVSYERVLSGQGLHNIYQFLASVNTSQASESINHEMTQKDPAFVISEHALDQSDPLCVKALDHMVAIYGAAAGNLALKFMAYGGVYLGGGVAPKILQKLESPIFLDAFTNKGRFSELLKTISVRVILNDKAALLGAGQCALQKHSQ